jgi:hypothetical protein
MGKSLFAPAAKLALIFSRHTRSTVFVVSESFATGFTVPMMVMLAAFAPTLTGEAFVAEFAEAVMVVMFATFATAFVSVPFAFAPAIPVMAALPVMREAFVTEFAEAMMVVMFARFATAFVSVPFTFAPAIPMMAALPVTGEAFVAELAEAVMVVVTFAPHSLFTFLPTVGETFAAKFAKAMMMVLAWRTALRATVLHFRILRSRSPRATWPTALRSVLGKLLVRPLPLLGMLPWSTLSKSLSGLHAERMMEVRLSLGWRAAALRSLRPRRVLISRGARLRPVHPLGGAWGQ